LTVELTASYIILSPSRAVSSAVEHRSYKPGVTGSKPVPPIKSSGATGNAELALNEFLSAES
jgi:hypothetical protein